MSDADSLDQYTPDQRARYEEVYAIQNAAGIGDIMADQQARWAAAGIEPPELRLTGASFAKPVGTESDPRPVDLLKPMTAPPLRCSDVPAVLADFADSHARATGFNVSILLAGGIGDRGRDALGRRAALRFSAFVLVRIRSPVDRCYRRPRIR